MSKKNTIYILLIALVLLPIVYLSLVQFQTYLIAKEVEDNFINSGVTNEDYSVYKAIRCNSSLLQPEIAFVNDIFYNLLPEYSIYFFDTEGVFNVEAIRTGATTVENTTFPELVKMVKEDCEQFKDGHASDVEGGPEWIYTRAQTEEEKIEEIRSGFIDKANKSSSFKEIYGDIDSMTNKEILILKEEIDKEGLNEKIHVEIEALRIRNKLYRLTDEQMEKVKERYGDLSELSDEELVEKDKQITADWESGDFVLD